VPVEHGVDLAVRRVGPQVVKGEAGDGGRH